LFPRRTNAARRGDPEADQNHDGQVVLSVVLPHLDRPPITALEASNPPNGAIVR